MPMVVTEARFNDLPVRVVVIDDDPWFLAADVAGVLGAGGRWQLVTASAGRDDSIQLSRFDIRAGASVLRTADPRDQIWFVSETGAYTASASLAVTAARGRTFRDWLIRELMPSIRVLSPASVRRTDLPLVEAKVTVERRKPPPPLEIRQIPHALYRLYGDAGDLLYIGISLNAAARVAQHRLVQSWWNEVSEVRLESYLDRDAALRAEAQAIKVEHPRYNVQHKVVA